MNLAYILRNWTMRSIHASILAAALIGSANVALAQPTESGGSKVPAKHITNVRSFDLPVDMPQEHRLALNEIRLYVRTPSTPWKLAEQQPNFATRFNCKINEDGEYWYTLVVIDKSGRSVPADLNTEAPSQRVVIDTVPPVIQTQPVPGVDGDLTLRCTLEDAHPDHASLKANYKTPTGLVPVDAIPGQAGVFRVRASEASQYPVIVTGRDLAGNVSTREVNLAALVAAKAPPPAPKTDIALTSSSRSDFRSTLPAPKVDSPSKVAPLNTTPPVPLPTSRTEPQMNRTEPPMPRIELPAGDPTPAITKTERIELPPATPTGPPGVLNPEMVSKDPPVFKVPANYPNPSIPEKRDVPVTEKRPSSGHPLINTEHASIEYRLDQVGPSGVGKVEVYMTTNAGQSWHRLGEDTDKRSPADIKLPGDGVYGIRIVVTNGNGFGGRAPVSGDAPHCTIEVDTTSPFVQLRSAEILPSSGQVEIRWNASDKNLGAEPVNLSYRTKTDGAWQLIARGIKNDGLYRWAFPRDAGAQFFFKVEVADQAGNLAQDSSRQPIVIDTTEPNATVITVTGNGTRPNQ